MRLLDSYAPPYSDDYVVEGGGFEPPKSLTTDLQSVPFGRSGIPPGMIGFNISLSGAPYPNRTDHLLITSQLLYQYELTGRKPFYYGRRNGTCTFKENFLGSQALICNAGYSRNISANRAHFHIADYKVPKLTLFL